MQDPPEDSLNIRKLSASYRIHLHIWKTIYSLDALPPKPQRVPRMQDPPEDVREGVALPAPGKQFRQQAQQPVQDGEGQLQIISMNFLTDVEAWDEIKFL